MTPDEFLKKIEQGSDILFTVRGRGFTILTWTDGGPNIGEWDRPETSKTFPDEKSLVTEYLIDGVPLQELTDEIVITEYT